MLLPDFSVMSIISPTLTSPSSISHRMKKSPLSPGVGVCAVITRCVVDVCGVEDPSRTGADGVPQEERMSTLERAMRRERIIGKN